MAFTSAHQHACMHFCRVDWGGGGGGGTENKVRSSTVLSIRTSLWGDTGNN